MTYCIGKKRQPADKETILVFRIGQLGDSLIALPAIDFIKRENCSSRMILLTDEQIGKTGYISSRDVYNPLKLFQSVISYNPARNYLDPLVLIFQLLKKLRNEGVKKIYNLSPRRNAFQRLRDKIVFQYLLGASAYYYDRKTKWPQRYSSSSVSQVTPEWKRLLQVSGGDSYDSKFRLRVPKEQKAESERIFNELNVDEKQRLVALGPGSKMPAKRWPKEYYAKLGTFLLERYPDVSLAVFGGPEDAALADELCARWGKRAFNLAGKLSIYGSAAALERCTVYVGNDTGTMHLAAMVGKPCVAIFSSRDYPGKWEPYGENHIILRTDPDCSGCMLEVCNRKMECLTAISPDDVLEKSTLLLNAKHD